MSGDTPEHRGERGSGASGAVRTGAPPGFVEHAHELSFLTPYQRSRVWRWLNDPATFVEGQIWPYRVEFVDGGFEPGVLNVHHRPFLNAAGVIGEIRDPQEGETAYRDLRYFYGSYAISPRLARPTRLQFWAEESGGDTRITLRFDSLVERRFARTWAILQGIFWRRFPRWMGSALRDPSDRAGSAQ